MDKFFLVGFACLIIGAILQNFFGAWIPSFVSSVFFYGAMLMFIIGIARKGGGPC